ncbi:phage head closure protein [Streptococcus suis]|uniref:phage head closure protein n=1 Tax=Streptococcus suis TaxID=1307 RepID=UPI003791A6D7
MEIAGLRERVNFEVADHYQDELGNDQSTFQLLFSRWANVEPLSSREREALGLVKIEEVISVLFRYDKAIASLDTRQVRLVFEGKVYNIHSMENLGFEDKTIRLRVTREVSHEQP